MKLTTHVAGAALVCGFLLGAMPGLEAWDGIPAMTAAASAEAAAGTDPAARSPQHELLVRAIRERRLINFTYGGFSRVLEPHAYGVSATGEAVLHGYQIAGGSASKPPPGWRTFTVSGVADVVLTERRFDGPRSDYSTERPKLDPQWAEIEGVASP